MLLLHRQDPSTGVSPTTKHIDSKWALGHCEPDLSQDSTYPLASMPQVLQGKVHEDILGLWVSCPLRSCDQYSSGYLVIPPFCMVKSPPGSCYRSLCGNTSSSSIWLSTSPWRWKVFPFMDHSLLQPLGSRSENWREPRNTTRDHELLMGWPPSGSCSSILVFCFMLCSYQ